MSNLSFTQNSNQDSDAFRGSWPMGRVTHTYAGSDGQVCVVDISQEGKDYQGYVQQLVKILGEDKVSSHQGENAQLVDARHTLQMN